jgi:hypothetical protein
VRPSRIQIAPARRILAVSRGCSCAGPAHLTCAKRVDFAEIDAIVRDMAAAGGLGRGMRNAQLVRWS